MSSGTTWSSGEGVGAWELFERKCNIKLFIKLSWSDIFNSSWNIHKNDSSKQLGTTHRKLETQQLLRYFFKNSWNDELNYFHHSNNLSFTTLTTISRRSTTIPGGIRISEESSHIQLSAAEDVFLAFLDGGPKIFDHVNKKQGKGQEFYKKRI